MNWLDSSSFSGLLSQAQKSIDKVLDIPREDDKKTNQNLDTGKSQSQTPKTQEKKSSEQKSSNSWLSGADSFWGSLTQNVSGSPKTDTTQDKEKSSNDVETKNKTTSERANDIPPKESKLSSKPMNLKRSSKKKIPKKKVETSDSHPNENSATKSTPENEAGTETETPSDLKVQSDVIKKHKDGDFTDVDIGSISLDTLDGKNFEASNDDSLMSDNAVHDSSGNAKVKTESDVTVEHDEDVLMTENGKVVQGKEEERGDLEVEVETMKQTEMMEQVEKLEPVENDRNNKMEDEDLESIDVKINEEMKVDNQSKNSQKFGVDGRSDFRVDKDFLENGRSDFGVDKNFLETEDEQPERHQEQQLVAESVQNLDLFSSPVAASTPQRKEPSHYNTPSNDQGLLPYDTDDNGLLSNLNDLLKASEFPENVEQDVVLDPGDKADKDSNISNEMTRVNDDVEGLESKSDSKQENERFRQIIEVRESKLIDLSKENLNLQETNAVLRSQIEQLEELHKSEDAELEQMKEEFTKRIGESEAKLQAAAKERDLFKKQLEETQKCLSSDMERQLKEFQSLLQEKDEQVAQLMEEGEKLSKQILQRNTNIKKLRAKEKELNASNENLSTKFEAAEAEIERLTGILKERDDHEKEQDDAIKKLNAYTKKQEDVIAKQKVELEESAAKLPSLQTALDNAYKEMTELHKVNAAKSTEVQEATLSVEMTAKEELRIALEKLKKESQRECDVLAMEVTDLQTQLNRSEQQAARREDNLRQEIADIQMRLQEAEGRNQELTQSVSVATRPLLRQIENLQHSYGSQQTSWEKLEKNLTERLADAQNQLATAQEKERASTERSIELSSRVASLESQVANYRQEKSRIEAEFELEKAKLEALEDYKSRESGKIEALKSMHCKQLETMMVEKSLLEQQLVVERTKYESERKKLTKLEEQLKERPQKGEDIAEDDNEQDPAQQTTSDRRRSRNSSSSSVFSLSDAMSRNLPSGGTAILEELRATIRHKEGELVSMQSAISKLESSRESLTEELTSLMNTNESLTKENKQLQHTGKSFQELQTKYNALLQMYGEKQEETEELKLDLQDIKNMYKTQIQELLGGR
ncbi:Hypothetical predicted protein [Paramuricea clavata]|uniref:Uncharacterized protein n=1 Tax=Paramuricea clavata TaxID=317549 RepID=A0A6S7I9L2_PARCT|nr:Hypothetical predicted protein [Paramuricea clavata]